MNPVGDAMAAFLEKQRIKNLSGGYICDRCGRTMVRPEGQICWDDEMVTYCHPDDPSLPDCFTLERREKGHPLS